MATIAPTITATEPHEYRAQVERVAPFAQRLHIDFSDGQFAPTKLVNVIQAWWPDNLTADFHLMLKRPMTELETVISLKPSLAIVHAEASGSFYDFFTELKGLGIKVGVALLQATPVEIVKPVLKDLNHVLIFSGHLGYHGGTADLSLLDKVRQLKQWRADLEIGWDGGITADNAGDLVRAGVDVLNVGAFVQEASDPAAVYAKLEEIIQHQNG